MTPIDFIRAVTPNSMQPRGVGLDQFRTFDPRRDELKMNLKPDSIFYSFGDIPLISFSDFVFLLTLLSGNLFYFLLCTFCFFILCIHVWEEFGRYSTQGP